MNCMKCGRETDEQVFCPLCQEDMARSPVKPGTPVVIYERTTKPRTPSSFKVDPEEQIQKLRRSVRGLRILVALLALLFALSAGAAGYLFFTDDQPPIGQNYNTMVDPEESTE